MARVRQAGDSRPNGHLLPPLPFPDDGSLRRIPQRIADALPFGRDAIPEFAGTRQKAAFVVLELQDAKPSRILDARGSDWTFDAKGRIDEDLQRSYIEHMEVLGQAERAKRTRVVDPVPEIKKRELQAREHEGRVGRRGHAGRGDAEVGAGMVPGGRAVASAGMRSTIIEGTDRSPIAFTAKKARCLWSVGYA